MDNAARVRNRDELSERFERVLTGRTSGELAPRLEGEGVPGRGGARRRPSDRGTAARRARLCAGAHPCRGRSVRGRRLSDRYRWRGARVPVSRAFARRRHPGGPRRTGIERQGDRRSGRGRGRRSYHEHRHVGDSREPGAGAHAEIAVCRLQPEARRACRHRWRDGGARTDGRRCRTTTSATCGRSLGVERAARSCSPRTSTRCSRRSAARGARGGRMLLGPGVGDDSVALAALSAVGDAPEGDLRSTRVAAGHGG